MTAQQYSDVAESAYEELPAEGTSPKTGSRVFPFVVASLSLAATGTLLATRTTEQPALATNLALQLPSGCEGSCSFGYIPTCRSQMSHPPSTPPRFSLKSLCKDCGCSGSSNVDFKDLGSTSSLSECDDKRKNDNFCGTQFVFGEGVCFCRASFSPCDQVSRPGSGWQVYDAIETAECVAASEEITMDLRIDCKDCTSDAQIQDAVRKAVANEAQVSEAQIAEVREVSSSTDAAWPPKTFLAEGNQEKDVQVKVVVTEDEKVDVAARLSNQAGLNQAFESSPIHARVEKDSISIAKWTPPFQAWGIVLSVLLLGAGVGGGYWYTQIYSKGKWMSGGEVQSGYQVAYQTRMTPVVDPKSGQVVGSQPTVVPVKVPLSPRTTNRETLSPRPVSPRQPLSPRSAKDPWSNPISTDGRTMPQTMPNLVYSGAPPAYAGAPMTTPGQMPRANTFAPRYWQGQNARDWQQV